MVGDDRLEKVKNKVESAEQLIAYLRKHSVGADQMNPILADLGSSPITQKTRSFNILARPHVHMQHVAQPDPKLAELLAHRESEDRKSTRLNSSHKCATRMPSSSSNKKQ